MMHKKRTFILLAALATAAVAQAQTDLDKSFLSKDEIPNAAWYLPAPPDTSSVAFLYDYNRYQWGRSLRSTYRGRIADFDTFWQTDSVLKGFAPVFGFYITRTSAPETYKLIARAAIDAEYGVDGAKECYMRKRPYMQFHEHTGCPTDEEELSHNGSYPSGHSAIGWATALLLAELNLSCANAIIQRGYEYGQSRVIEGYHYQSDVDAARLSSSAVVATLHGDAEFQKQMEKARRELARLMRKPVALDVTKARLTEVAPLQGKSGEGYQGMAIWGDWVVSCQNQGYVTLYRLPGMKKVSSTFSLGSCAKTNHANVAAFGTEYYKQGDSMPVLYVSQAYPKTVGGEKDVCYVERILPEGRAETVQRIVFDDTDHLYGYALQWTVDREHQRLIGLGNTISNDDARNCFRIITFQLPKLSDGPVVHLRRSDADACYLIQTTDPRYPHQVVGQGACVKDGCLYMPTGFGSEKAPSIVYVWDLNKRKLRHIIDLSKELNKVEMEDIDFYQGDAYIQTNGRGMLKLGPLYK